MVAMCYNADTRTKQPPTEPTWPGRQEKWRSEGNQKRNQIQTPEGSEAARMIEAIYSALLLLAIFGALAAGNNG